MRPRLSELVASARLVSIPLRSKFRGLTERELLIFEGPQGHSEWAAFTEYSDEEAAIWLEAAIEWGFTALPTPSKSSVFVNAILPAVPHEEVSKILSRAGKFRTVKIKVAEPGQSITDDLARIDQVLQLYPESKLRLDANGGYQVDQALELLEALSKKNISLQYVEQPVATIAELAELKLKANPLGFLVAADEAVRKASDPLAVELAGAADVLVLKSAPLGGVQKALTVASQSSLPVVASSAMQSSIGLAAELHFAASLDSDFDAGLGTLNLFAGDLVSDSLKPIDGELEFRRPKLSESAMETLRAEDHRYDWWIARLERCGRLIGLES